MARDNRSLGRFHLDGIPPAPRGVPQVEISLDIDANGILSVTAKDKATNKENKIRIEGGSQLTKEEIEQMKADAEANAESDKVERELVDKLNNADTMIFQTEKQIKEFDDKLTDEDREALKADLETLKEVHSQKDVTKIDEATSKLNETWSGISTRLYQQTEAQPEQPVNEGDNIEDVAYEDVTEEK
jgi:molecular chaperone DnaK